MLTNRKIRIIGLLAFLVVIGGVAASPAGPEAAFMDRAAPAPGREFKNLKVLPGDISSKRLQQIMVDEFNDGLGVGCGFCHAEQKDSHRLDYASDAKPEKEIARAMMRMAIKINRKYFQDRHPMIGDSTLVITCTTCHRGQARPENGTGE
jgi:cytochrome c553